MLAGLRKSIGLVAALSLGSLSHARAQSGAARPSHARAQTVEPPSRLTPLRIAAEWGNDQLYSSNGDDLGFTQDLTVQVHHVSAHDDFWLRARQRLMIERGGEQRRTDEMTFELGWLTEHPWGPFVWSFGPTLALVLSGNYGGAKLQNAWHQLLDNGYTFDSGLSDNYAPHRTGLVVGGRGGPSWLPLPWLRLLVGVEASGAVGGTGQSLLALYDALEFESGKPGFRLVLTGGIDYERSWTPDPTLALPGGYDTSGIYRTTHLRMAARGREWEAGFRAQTNVGGSEGHQGMIYVLIGGGEGFRHEHALR